MKSNRELKDVKAFLGTALVLGIVVVSVNNLDLSGLSNTGRELVYIAIAVAVVAICRAVPLLRGSRPSRRDFAAWQQWRRERAVRYAQFMVGFFALMTVGCFIIALVQLFSGADGAVAGNVYIGATCFSAIMLAISIILRLALKKLQK